MIDVILDGIEKDIEEILYEYVKAQSFTNTRNEKQAEDFFQYYFSTDRKSTRLNSSHL